MSALIARAIERFHGGRAVLKGCDLVVTPSDRVGLVGANGSGKSTLLRILGGADKPDHGTVTRQGRVGMLAQDPVLPGRTVREAAEEAVAWHRELISGYHAALERHDMARASVLQDRLDLEGWSVEHRIDGLLDRLRAPAPETPVDRLSGGEQRRVALARVLLSAPDVLLLDEPTNHLDAETVEWLQGYLTGYRGAVVLVTHDRYLLEAVADRIVEIEDGRCVTYDDHSYGDYLLARVERQALMEKAEGRRLAMLRREAAWAARSPAARSTKQKARLDRLERLSDQEALRGPRDMDLDLRSGLKLGSTILELHGLRKRFGATPILSGLDLVLTPGDRIGVLGPNGAGKSTLLRLVTGQLEPDAGELIKGARVRFGLLDQHRTGLDESKTLFEEVGEGNDHVKVGERYVHVATFLERFLFPRQMFDQKVAGLSGGERARLLLAKLLLQGANVLLLDEPTNDLDLVTLRVLEEALLDYDGCALVVTHDRAFLDRVCTGVLGFHGEGEVVRYADRTQFNAEQGRRAQARLAADAAAAPPSPAPSARPRESTKKLSFKEKKELDELPAQIERLEAEQGALERVLADPATYQSRRDEVAELSRQLDEFPARIEALYDRWEQLSERA